jgi:protein-tyrosine phosphatase
VGRVAELRTISVQGLTNACDLGGLRRLKGLNTPTGVFLRSESVDGISTPGWRVLHDLGVRSVVDLRQDAEREGDAGSRPAWLQTVPVDHDGLENRTLWADYWDNGRAGTALYYLAHLQAMPERTLAVLQAIATAPPGGVLFHCASGRDRTGLIAAILLEIAGVEREAIVTDYLLGRAHAPAHDRAVVEAECEAVCRAAGTTIEAAFRDALAGMDVSSLLGGLPDESRTAITTWRGALAS